MSSHTNDEAFSGRGRRRGAHRSVVNYCTNKCDRRDFGLGGPCSQRAVPQIGVPVSLEADASHAPFAWHSRSPLLLSCGPINCKMILFGFERKQTWRKRRCAPSFSGKGGAVYVAVVIFDFSESFSQFSKLKPHVCGRWLIFLSFFTSYIPIHGRLSISIGVRLVSPLRARSSLLLF